MKGNSDLGPLLKGNRLCKSRVGLSITIFAVSLFNSGGYTVGSSSMPRITRSCIVLQPLNHISSLLFSLSDLKIFTSAQSFWFSFFSSLYRSWKSTVFFSKAPNIWHRLSNFFIRSVVDASTALLPKSVLSMNSLSLVCVTGISFEGQSMNCFYMAA